MKTIFLTVLLTLAIPVASFAETIEIHGKTELSLGVGVNPLTERPYQRCIEYEEAQYEDGSSSLKKGEVSAVSLPVHVEHITSYEQMSKYSSSSMSASVSYSFVSGSLSHSEVNSSSMFSDQASVGLDLSADYGRWFLQNVKLKPEYEKLARENRAEFYRRCGTEYVAGYRLGQGIRVKMSTSASASSSYSKVTTAVGAAVKSGLLGAGLAGSFENAAASLMTASALEINMFSYGVGALKNIHKVIKTENDAVKFRNTIAGYVQSLNTSDAVKTHYITQAYFPGDVAYDPLLIEVKKSTVRSLYSDFLMLLSHKERIEKAVRNGKLRSFLGDICEKKTNECETYITKMEGERAWLEGELENIRQLAIVCIEGDSVPDCKTNPKVHIQFDRLQSIIWPIHYRYRLMQSYLQEIKDRDDKDRKRKPLN